MLIQATPNAIATSEPLYGPDDIDGQLLLDLFMTMAVNVDAAIRRNRRPFDDNRVLTSRLEAVMPKPPGYQGTYREWGLFVRATALTGECFNMRRHPGRQYAGDEAGPATVSGALTTINHETGSFCLDPRQGPNLLPDKDAEVCVIPVDRRTLLPAVRLEVLGIRPEALTNIPLY